MKIAIIDAEIIGKSRHRFPNLCSMKLSAYHKTLGDVVELKLDYEALEAFDLVYISKVFTKTKVPKEVLHLPHVQYGGTGFFYDKAPSLPAEVEHGKPDYTLYLKWVEEKLKEGVRKVEFQYYLDYSIGYLTRGCFRGCKFCVNRNCKESLPASPLEEFLDVGRSKLCFLDDNFFACASWESLIQPVVLSGKRFMFRQGLDERLLTKEKIIALSTWPYEKEVFFAFDCIEDKDLIVSKLQLLRKTVPDWKRELKFYVFCGWDAKNQYEDAFWEQDIATVFERIKVLKAFGATPYLMRFEKVYDSKFSSFYATLAAWCNQPSMFKMYPFRLYAQCSGMQRKHRKVYGRDVEAYRRDIGIKGSSWEAMEYVEGRFPHISKEYYDFVGK